MSCVPRGRCSFTREARRGTDSARARRRASSRTRGRSRRPSRADRPRPASGSTRAGSPSRRKAGRCGRPSGEEHVAGEEAAVGVVGDVTRRVPRHMPNLEGDSRRLDGLAAAQARRLAAVRARQDSREEVVRAAEDIELAFRQPDRSPRALGEVGERPEVVVVAVRDQDRRAGRARPREVEPDLGCVGSRVDDDRCRRCSVGANEVAIRPDRAERELFDCERHGRMSLPALDGRPAIPALPDDVPDTAPGTTLALAKAASLGCGRVRPPAWSGTPPGARGSPGSQLVQSWNLLEVDAPAGTRDPVVVHSATKRGRC